MSSQVRADQSRPGRREALVRLRGLATIVILSLAGCELGPESGPGTIHWDRETCEHCQMVISEKRHAVQIRLPGDRQTHAFDDLGCGLLWLDQQGLEVGGANGPEIWVKDSKAGDWIDGRKAEFASGLTTPMAYGFGVVEQGLSLAEVQIAVRETERRRRSPAADQMDRRQRAAHTQEDRKGEDLD